MAEQPTSHSGFVTLLGIPNAGKSTLLNRFIGSKVSIVTHKVQTTRTLIRGILVVDDTQIVFVDTPGIFQPKRQLERAMVKTAWNGARDADLILVLVDAQMGLHSENELLFSELKTLKQKKVLVINKVDQVERPSLLSLTAKLNEQIAFERTFMVSALNGSGCSELLNYVKEAMPAGPWYYPEDQMSDMPLRQLAAEITREKLFLRLHEELPYSSTVETERWEERQDGSVKIDQVIFVARQSQKKIILGKNGSTIKAIGQAARRELMTLLEQQVHLFLFVKVRENWLNDPERYRELGLDFSK